MYVSNVNMSHQENLISCSLSSNRKSQKPVGKCLPEMLDYEHSKVASKGKN